MNQLELDLIDFIAERNGESAEIIRTRYEQIAKHDLFGKEYDTYSDIAKVFFSDKDEKSVFEAYKHFAYNDILHMVALSKPKKATIMGYIRTFLKRVNNPGYGKSASLIDFISDDSIVLDYGCGIAKKSFGFGKHTILLDLDTVKLDFAEYRFRKHGLSVSTIRATKENPYPNVPKHDVCIADEVLEHVHDPVKALNNILKGKPKYIYGDFDDHEDEMFHVSPDLSRAREIIIKHFTKIAPKLYKAKMV